MSICFHLDEDRHDKYTGGNDDAVGSGGEELGELLRGLTRWVLGMRVKRIVSFTCNCSSRGWISRAGFWSLFSVYF